MARYYSSKQGFFDLKDKETIVLEVEGCLNGIREYNDQFRNGIHIFELVEIKFTNNDVVCLDKGKKWHLSIIRNLVEAYKQGRIFPGVLLKFEIYQDDTIPKTSKMRINRFMRVYIANSPIAEPVNFNEDGYIPRGTKEMIDDLYAKCKAQYETR